MAHHKELAMLLSSVIESLTQGLDDGDGKHRELEWLNETPRYEHSIRAERHLSKMIFSDDPVEMEHHLDHTITRLVMIKCQIHKEELIQEVSN